jgi:hypothetical protein
MQYDNTLRKQRRMLRPHLSPTVVTNHYPTLYEYAQVMLDGLKTSPEQFHSHIQQ